MSYQVWLARQPDYREEDLDALMEEIFTELHIYDKLRPGMTAVLKPNLVIRSRPEDAAATHPAFAAAVGRQVKRAGAKVLIVESPGGPYTPGVMKAHYKACGYTDMAESNGFSLYTDCKSREVSLPEGKVCRRAAVIEPFLDAEYLIDLAKLKTHGMVGYSGAVKNLFGAVPGLQKPELHCRFPGEEEFSQMLDDLCVFLKPDLCFLDGIWAMEGDGPTSGTRRELGAVVASENPWAADLAASAMIGFEPGEILHLKYGGERGLGPAGLEDLELLGDGLSSLSVRDFRRAKASSPDFIRKLPKFLQPAAKRLATPWPRIDEKDCVGCGKCAESCPQHTIHVEAGKAKIDYKSCIHCFCCQEMCPRHIIGVRRLGLFRL